MSFFLRCRCLVTDGLERSYRPPLILSPYVPLGLSTLLILVAIGYEVLVVVVNEQRGGLGPIVENVSVAHWSWALPPVAIATALSLSVAALHFTAQRMEPLADLAAGRSVSTRSLHLDYLSMPLPLVFFRARRNRHHTVALTAWMTICAPALTSLSSTIFVIQTDRKPSPVYLIQTTRFGVTSNRDLTDFSASAAITYALFADNATFPKYTSKFFALPAFNRSYTNNVSVPVSFYAQAIHSQANCQLANVTSVASPNSSVSSFVASGGGLPNGCTFEFE